MRETDAKPETITFKVEPWLAEALRSVPNKSEFIRRALGAAFDRVCPLCRGAGVLTETERRHWDDFAVGHALTRCEECHARHLVCLNGEGQSRGASSSKSP